MQILTKVSKIWGYIRFTTYRNLKIYQKYIVAMFFNDNFLKLHTLQIFYKNIFLMFVIKKDIKITSYMCFSFEIIVVIYF